jgi:hypothetical protein
VEQLVREGAETVIGGSRGSISLGGICSGFLAGHFVEQVAFGFLDGRGGITLNFCVALQGKMARGGLDRTCTRIRGSYGEFFCSNTIPPTVAAAIRTVISNLDGDLASVRTSRVGLPWGQGLAAAGGRGSSEKRRR